MFFSPPTWTSPVLFHEINELQSGPPESNALDTGAQSNQVETSLARKLGLPEAR